MLLLLPLPWYPPPPPPHTHLAMQYQNPTDFFMSVLKDPEAALGLQAANLKQQQQAIHTCVHVHGGAACCLRDCRPGARKLQCSC